MFLLQDVKKIFLAATIVSKFPIKDLVVFKYANLSLICGFMRMMVLENLRGKFKMPISNCWLFSMNFLNVTMNGLFLI